VNLDPDDRPGDVTSDMSVGKREMAISAFIGLRDASRVFTFVLLMYLT